MEERLTLIGDIRPPNEHPVPFINKSWVRQYRLFFNGVRSMVRRVLICVGVQLQQTSPSDQSPTSSMNQHQTAKSPHFQTMVAFLDQYILGFSRNSANALDELIVAALADLVPYQLNGRCALKSPTT